MVENLTLRAESDEKSFEAFHDLFEVYSRSDDMVLVGTILDTLGSGKRLTETRCTKLYETLDLFRADGAQPLKYREPFVFVAKGTSYHELRAQRHEILSVVAKVTRDQLVVKSRKHAADWTPSGAPHAPPLQPYAIFFLTPS